MHAQTKSPLTSVIREATHFEGRMVNTLEELISIQNNPSFSTNLKLSHHGKNFLFVVRDTSTPEKRIAGILRGYLRTQQTGRISAQLYPFILAPQYAKAPEIEFAVKRRLLERAVNQFNTVVDEIVFTPHRVDKFFLNQYKRLFFDNNVGNHYKLKIRPRTGTFRPPALGNGTIIVGMKNGKQVELVRPFGRRRVSSAGEVSVTPFKFKARRKR